MGLRSETTNKRMNKQRYKIYVENPKTGKTHGSPLGTKTSLRSKCTIYYRLTRSLGEYQKPLKRPQPLDNGLHHTQWIEQ